MSQIYPRDRRVYLVLRLESVGKDKLDTRWENGIFVGLREESGEIFVSNEQGVIKVRSYLQRPEGERWNQEEFDLSRGTPWEPIPGMVAMEIKSRFRLSDEADQPIIKELETRESSVRRLYIKKADIEKYGSTVGCPGCTAANRGGVSVPHNDKCRERIESNINTDDPERVGKALSRMVEGLEKVSKPWPTEADTKPA